MVCIWYLVIAGSPSLVIIIVKEEKYVLRTLWSLLKVAIVTQRDDAPTSFIQEATDNSVYNYG